MGGQEEAWRALTDAAEDGRHDPGRARRGEGIVHIEHVTDVTSKRLRKRFD
jgi:hypothetical protein